MSFAKRDFENRSRRVWEISPETRITPSAKINIKKDRAKVDWKTELEDAEEEQAFLDDDLTTGDE